jgi:hypothetical protein
MNVIFLDSFDTVSDLRGKNRTYENIKAAVLTAGKFSCFDVETEKDGRMFTDLCSDPEVEIFDMSYPWTGVRRRTQQALDGDVGCAPEGESTPKKLSACEKEGEILCQIEKLA